MNEEELRNSDFYNYIPKCVPAQSIGFIQYEIQNIEHRDNIYRITFKDGLYAPGVIMPDNLEFKPETDMKVIWDSAGLGSEGYLSFYDKQGKQLCALHKERMSNVWHNLTQELADKELRKKLGIPESVAFTPETRKQAERIFEEYGHMPTPEEIDAKFKRANELEQKAKAESQLKNGVTEVLISSGLRRIRKHYGRILEDQDELATSEGEDAENLQEGINRSREEIERVYKRINPKLAALREQERNGTITKEQRREAVKAHYNQKQPREDR